MCNRLPGGTGDSFDEVSSRLRFPELSEEDGLGLVSLPVLAGGEGGSVGETGRSNLADSKSYKDVRNEDDNDNDTMATDLLVLLDDLGRQWAV